MKKIMFCMIVMLLLCRPVFSQTTTHNLSLKINSNLQLTSTAPVFNSSGYVPGTEITGTGTIVISANNSVSISKISAQITTPWSNDPEKFELYLAPSESLGGLGVSNQNLTITRSDVWTEIPAAYTGAANCVYSIRFPQSTPAGQKTCTVTYTITAP